MVDSPVNYVYLKPGENEKFDHFFENSFMHYYLRSSYISDFDLKTRHKLATNKCNQIKEICTFLVGIDKIDSSVFYHYTAFFNSHDSVVIMMAYTKKNLRGFGIFEKALDLLCKDSKNNYYTYYLKNPKISNLKRRYV